MKKKTIFCGMALLIASAFGGVSQANSVFVFDTDGQKITAGKSPGATQYSASCDGPSCMQGIFGPVAAPSFSDTSVTGYSVGAVNNELNFLNGLLATSSLSQPTVSFVKKTDGGGTTFTTDREYFSIKQQTWTAYFKNTSGGAITITFGPNAFSHFTEYGQQLAAVPLPAAAWLFGSALLGLAGVGYRRKLAQTA